MNSTVSVINMRSITVLVLACACALASGFFVTKDVKYADQPFLVKQRYILELLQHIHQNEVFGNYEEMKALTLVHFKDYFTKTEVFDEFSHIYEHGMLGLNEVFTIMYPPHRKEAIALFNMFYYAKDSESFFKFASWARFFVNEGVFMYAFRVAVHHRKDMQGVVMPAPYEVYPYYYFNSEVIGKAQYYKMRGFYGMKKVEDTYTVIIPSNYTEYYDYANPEHKLSYFTEDIGLNSYHLNFHSDYPFWMDGERFNLNKDRRGERFIFYFRQLLSRYYMERLSNDVGRIPEFSFFEPIKTGYFPRLRYYTGVFFPSRGDNYQLNYFQDGISADGHIRDLIFDGRFPLESGKYVNLTKPEAVEYLGNLIQGNPDSIFTRFHGYLTMYVKMLRYSMDQHTFTPGVFEHFETALNDPFSYQLYKHFMTVFHKYQRNLPHYTYEELNFKGVTIESVEIDKLITYFDIFDSDVTNAVDVEMLTQAPSTPLQKAGRLGHYNGHDFVIKARQSRLNHMPFTFKLHVKSDEAKKAIVKVFIGPKFDEVGHLYTFEENRENFYELDHFLVDLVAGRNDIVRKSEEFFRFVKDRTTYFDLYKYVMRAIKGEYKFPLDMTEAHCGFPDRLMLPKGKVGGMQFQFFFFVTEYVPPKVEQYTGFDRTLSCGIGSGARFIDDLPFGYPFDRPIDEEYWLTPNMYYYDVNIFHKKEVEVNTVY